MPTFQTHTGLTLDKAKGKDAIWRVIIFSSHEPDRAKTLYEGLDETAAQREYAKWKGHYELRAQTDPPDREA